MCRICIAEVCVRRNVSGCGVCGALPRVARVNGLSRTHQSRRIRMLRDLADHPHAGRLDRACAA